MLCYEEDTVEMESKLTELDRDNCLVGLCKEWYEQFWSVVRGFSGRDAWREPRGTWLIHVYLESGRENGVNLCVWCWCKIIRKLDDIVIRVVRLAKSDFGSVFQKKNCGFRFGFGFTKLTAVSVFGSVFCTVQKCRDTAWRKILWLLILSCCKMNCEWDNVKTVPKRPKSFFENRMRKPSFRFLNFEVYSVRFLENRYPKFSSDSAHP